VIPLYDDQPARGVPAVTLILIAANVLVFAAWQLRVGLEASVEAAALVPAALGRGANVAAYPGVFTSMFMHGGWMHLLGNMWFLWIFGNNIEDACGPLRFTLFYIGCGVAAAAAHVALRPDSPVPMVGASGAVSGVLGGYLVLHPGARVLTALPLGPFVRPVMLPAYVYLLVWIGFQVVSQLAAAGGSGGGVAYMAHIGGFVAGVVGIKLFERRRRAGRARRASR
jgi:membrane associated rhomboid family serine protease